MSSFPCGKISYLGLLFQLLPRGPQRVLDLTWNEIGCEISPRCIWVQYKPQIVYLIMCKIALLTSNHFLWHKSDGVPKLLLVFQVFFITMEFLFLSGSWNTKENTAKRARAKQFTSALTFVQPCKERFKGQFRASS